MAWPYPSYQEYLALKAKGLRIAANAVAKEVVCEFRETPDERFILHLCEEKDGQRINHILWKGIVFPYVTENLTTQINAMKCLINSIQNLYSDKKCHRLLDFITEYQLIEKLYELVPEDNWARGKRIKSLRAWLQYTIHEWPSGILYGMDGATFEQCDEIQAAAQELKTLDTHSTDFADDVEAKLRDYRKQIEIQSAPRKTN